MKPDKSKLGIRYDVSVFYNREAAFRYAERCKKPHTVILGDKNQFWVATYADAQKLVRQGYECVL